MSESYYELLGVSPEASVEEIEEAYREKVKEYHPDTNDDPDAREMFMRIREAKDVLTDPEKKAEYDGSDTDWTEPRSPDRTGSANGGHTKDYFDRHAAHYWLANREPLLDQFSRLIEHAVWETLRTIDFLRPPYPKLLTWENAYRFVTAPTVMRLTATSFLLVLFTVLLPLMGITLIRTPISGLILVLVSLLVSYSVYGLLTPLPFEEQRTRARYVPGDTDPLWPIVATNLFSILLVGIAAIQEDLGAGLGFIAGSLGAVLLMSVTFALLFRYVLTTLLGALHIPVAAVVAQSGSLLGMVLTPFVLFTELGGPISLPAIVTPTPTPWIGRFQLGPFYLGVLVNVLIGITLGIVLLWSVIAMLGRLTTAPWNDRYEHGYRVSPSAWNYLLVAPILVFLWMGISGLTELRIPIPFFPIDIGRTTLFVLILFLPTVLTGIYLLRRRLEPYLRKRRSGSGR